MKSTVAVLLIEAGETIVRAFTDSCCKTLVAHEPGFEAVMLSESCGEGEKEKRVERSHPRGCVVVTAHMLCVERSIETCAALVREWKERCTPGSTFPYRGYGASSCKRTR
jgi:hypothetical protein